jgi:hypothetical protein
VTYTVAVDLRIEADTPARAVAVVKEMFAALRTAQPPAFPFLVSEDVWPYVEG